MYGKSEGLRARRVRISGKSEGLRVRRVRVSRQNEVLRAPLWGNRAAVW